MIALLYQLKTKKTKKPECMYEDYFKDKLLNMVFQIKGDLTTKCRICLQEGTTLLNGTDHSEEIAEVLEIFNIQIKEGEDLPNKLCIMCSKFIGTVISFRKTAKLAEELLNRPVKMEVKNYDPPDDHLDTFEYSDDTSQVDTDKKWDECKEIKKETKVTLKSSAKVTCHICKKVVSRAYIKQHLTMHDPDPKKYVCDVCGKSFRLRCAYHNHSLRHRTDFPFKCQFCPYRGRYSELLKNHMRTHTGDYRYMCTECPARFLFKSNLNSHMLKHKEPKFKCELCKRAFHTKLAMQRHFEADHLGIKNHVCNICGKAFGYRNAMMKHQRHVHKREKLLFGRMPSYLQAENKSAS